MRKEIIKQREESSKQRAKGSTQRFSDVKSKGKFQTNSELETEKQSNIQRDKKK
jgi:hypothetical protein